MRRRSAISSVIEPKRATVPRAMPLPRDYDAPVLRARARAGGRRRALDAADRARPVPRRPPLRRAAGPPRHPARGAQRPAGDARRARASSSAARTRPAATSYVLTERGRELWPVVHQLMQWGERHLVDGGAVRLFSHAACGTGLDAVGACPACGVTPAPADVETRPGPGASPLRQDAVSRALRAPAPAADAARLDVRRARLAAARPERLLEQRPLELTDDPVLGREAVQRDLEHRHQRGLHDGADEEDGDADDRQRPRRPARRSRSRARRAPRPAGTRTGTRARRSRTTRPRPRPSAA